MKDKLVIDIETKNTFADVGGHQNVERLEISYIGAYSYNQDKYFGFHEHELDKFAPILQNASLVIGFATKRFDLPVMKKYYNFNIMALPQLDLLEEVEIAHGQRVSLDILAQANLSESKTGHGLDAIKYYQQGNLKALEDYCLQDVKVTKMLYDHIKEKGHVIIPQKFSGEPVKVSINIQEMDMPATLF
ncbi:MAG: ribonuclease H-like domain-containing protein [Patescibacteria group bacterium]